MRIQLILVYFIEMLGDTSQSGEFLWDPKTVAFAAVHHVLEGVALLVVSCWVFSICDGVAAWVVCP